MAEVGIDLTTHTSKTLHELPDPWSFDLALTVCDDANEACPTYPAHTIRRHLSVPDPSEHDLTTWRQVRDGLGRTSRLFIDQLTRHQTPSNAELAAALTAPT